MPVILFIKHFSFFLRFYLFSEIGERREKERERNTDERKKHQLVASRKLPTSDLACNPGMCPEWELNWQPLGPQASAQSTEPHQPGQNSFSYSAFKYFMVYSK